jgi:glycosyltransferase involved in cell wall biosynthesis
MNSRKITILFFIGSLTSGGKERRLLELITFLGNIEKYRLVLVTKKTEIYFENFKSLKMEWVEMETEKIGLKTFLEFLRIARRVKPDIVHTWGGNYTLITLPYLFINRSVKLVNSQITSAPPRVGRGERLICRLNFKFSNVILANSTAGIEAFNAPRYKSKVIFNGLNFKRFENLKPLSDVRMLYNLDKKYTVIMVGSYSPNKDFLKFFRIGIEVTKLRNDTKFIGIGFAKGQGERLFQECIEITKDFPNLIPMPGSSQIEVLVNACDIGVLLSPNGEGLSNAILEYMALGKPVIANDAGGTKEIVENKVNGYLLNNESEGEIAILINDLLNDPPKMKIMGEYSRERIYMDFSLERMGTAFEKIYQELL